MRGEIPPVLLRVGIYFSQAASFPGGDLLNEMRTCSLLPKCSSCDGGILKLEQVH